MHGQPTNNTEAGLLQEVCETCTAGNNHRPQNGACLQLWVSVLQLTCSLFSSTAHLSSASFHHGDQSRDPACLQQLARSSHESTWPENLQHPPITPEQLLCKLMEPALQRLLFIAAGQPQCTSTCGECLHCYEAADCVFCTALQACVSPYNLSTRVQRVAVPVACCSSCGSPLLNTTRDFRIAFLMFSVSSPSVTDRISPKRGSCTQTCVKAIGIDHGQQECKNKVLSCIGKGGSGADSVGRVLRP